MKYVLCMLAVFCFAFLVTTPAVAEEKTHEGTVVSATDGKLTMKDKDGKEHMHKVAPDVKITFDGRDIKLDELKAGYKIKVTMKEGAVNEVAKIEARKE